MRRHTWYGLVGADWHTGVVVGVPVEPSGVSESPSPSNLESLQSLEKRVELGPCRWVLELDRKLVSSQELCWVGNDRFGIGRLQREMVKVRIGIGVEMRSWVRMVMWWKGRWCRSRDHELGRRRLVGESKTDRAPTKGRWTGG